MKFAIVKETSSQFSLETIRLSKFTNNTVFTDGHPNEQKYVGLKV